MVPVSPTLWQSTLQSLTMSTSTWCVPAKQLPRAGVEPVGLGELPSRLRERAHVAQVGVELHQRLAQGLAPVLQRLRHRGERRGQLLRLHGLQHRHQVVEHAFQLPPVVEEERAIYERANEMVLGLSSKRMAG